MKIAYVYDAVYPWETGGVQKRVWELAQRLADDHEVHWYGLKYWEGPRVIEREGVILHGVAPSRQLYVDGRRSITEALAFAARLARPLLTERFDVIDCQAFPYFPIFTSKLASTFRNETLLVTWHEIWGEYWYEYLGRKGIFGKGVEKLSSLVPDAHVAVSERTRRDVTALGATDVRLLPNGVDIREINAAAATDDRIDVLFVGRLIPEKNADLLVGAIDHLRERDPDVRCLLVGDGPDRERIETAIRAHGLDGNVQLSRFRDSREELLGLVKGADVFASPSRREGFGIAALEALACGTPVVTIAHPQNAVQELVIDGKTGTVCEPTDEVFAAGISRARETVSGSDCRDYARSYEWDMIAERAEAIYRRVARDESRRRRWSLPSFRDGR